MKKYFDNKSIILCFLLTLIVGLATPFNTWSYSQIFAMVEAGDKRRVVLEVCLIVLVIFLLTVARYFYERTLNRNIYLFNKNVRSDLLSSDFVKQQGPVSDKLSFVTNDLELVENNYVKEVFNLITSIVNLLLCLAMAINANFILTLVFMLFSVISAIAPKIMAKRVMESSKAWSASVGKYTGFMSDYLKHIDLILHYNAMPFFLLKGKKAITETAEAKQKRENTIAMSNLLAGILAYTLSFLPIGIGILFVLDKRLPLSSFIMVQYSSSWIVNSILAINRSMTTINSAKPLLTKLTNIKELPQSTLSDEMTTINFKDLQLNDVTFGYQDKTIIQNASLTVNRGDKILLTGRSGQGKSTLLRLMANIIQPNKGTVELVEPNGKAVSPQPDYFGEVNQDSNIFHDTLRFNLTLGRDFSDQEIEHAIQEAGLTPLMQKIGLDAVIQEDGTNLSGGEKKRIEIARAFLYNRNFLLIDEGTASLDPQTAHEIHEMILSSDLTVVEIDHHIPEDLQSKFTHAYKLEDKQLIPIS